MFQEILRKFTGKAPSEERQELTDSLKETRAALCRAYDGFNRAGDPDLVESYVFEINALQRRYSYLLRQVRQLEPSATAN